MHQIIHDYLKRIHEFFILFMDRLSLILHGNIIKDGLQRIDSSNFEL